MRPSDAIRQWIDAERDSIPPDVISAAYELEREVSSAAYASLDITEMTPAQTEALLGRFLLVRQDQMAEILAAARAHVDLSTVARSSMRLPEDAPAAPAPDEEPAGRPRLLPDATAGTRVESSSPPAHSTSPPPPPAATTGSKGAPSGAAGPTARATPQSSSRGTPLIPIILATIGLAGLLVAALRQPSSEPAAPIALPVPPPTATPLPTRATFAELIPTPTPRAIDFLLDPTVTPPLPSSRPGTIGDPLALETPALVAVAPFNDRTTWEITVGRTFDLLTSPYLPADDRPEIPADIVMATVPVSMKLVDAPDQPRGQNFEFSFVMIGGLSGAVYDSPTLQNVRCESTTSDFDRFREAFEGGTLEGLVCLPIRLGDFASPGLSFVIRPILGPEVVFAAHGEHNTNVVGDPAPDTVPDDRGPTGSWRDPHPHGSSIRFASERIADPSTWRIAVEGPLIDLTAAVLDENEFNDPPVDGWVFAGFEVTAELLDSDEARISPGANLQWRVFGGSSRLASSSISYPGGFIGCGVTPNDLAQAPAVEVGDTLRRTVCVPIPAEDLDDPATTVALRSGDSDVVFALGDAPAG
ncbi:MAG: hypothetical protein AAF567_00830 [Actinomycetota bacterium]